MITRLARIGLICVLGASVLQAAPDAVSIPDIPTADAIAAAPSFGADEPVVAAHYFYWYKWPSEHFFDGGDHTDSGLRQHFPDDSAVDYESVAWHRRQMRDMVAAGIDVALCVYWGAPNQYDKPDIRFSVAGLPPLVAALDELASTGRAPRIALFCDTSTLLAQHAFRDGRTSNVDLRTDEGKDIFYRTIRDFFRLVPPRHWACLDGRPIVQLYGAGFAAGHDQSTLDYIYKRFAEDFAGRRPFVIAGPSWSFKADACTGWGAALNGPLLDESVAQVGAGYDDSPVPGRSTPTRDRLAGGYYRASWMLALQRHPRLVIIETWDELHEGTGICETLEDDRFYIDLTRQFSDLLKSGKAPSGDDWATTVRTLLQAPHSNPAGREFASRIVVDAHVAADGRLVEEGLRFCRNVADGLWEAGAIGDSECVETRPGVGAVRYLYFDIADPYYYDHRGTLTLSFDYFDGGRAPILVEYDSTDDTGAIADRYRQTREQIQRTDTNTWKTAVVKLDGARCANRENGGADFRLVSAAGELAVRCVRVSKLPEGYGQ